MQTKWQVKAAQAAGEATQLDDGMVNAEAVALRAENMRRRDLGLTAAKPRPRIISRSRA